MFIYPFTYLSWQHLLGKLSDKKLKFFQFPGFVTLETSHILKILLSSVENKTKADTPFAVHTSKGNIGSLFVENKKSPIGCNSKASAFAFEIIAYGGITPWFMAVL